jgi:hypothetical protein
MALEIAAVGRHHVMRLVILSIVGIAKEKWLTLTSYLIMKRGAGSSLASFCSS